MKIDLKSALILILLCSTLFFVWKWYSFDSSEYKKQIDSLREENKKIIKTRDSIDEVISSLQNKKMILELKAIEIIGENMKLNKELKNEKNKANKSKEDLLKLLKEIAETKEKIEELKKNPPNRKEDDLLNSLKKKLQK
jgi:cell division protein YceG involved in septum cleavage